MPLEASTIGKTDSGGLEGLPVIDCDVHNYMVADRLRAYLPKRWREYVETAGLRWSGVTGAFSTQRPEAVRLDAFTASGAVGGTDPEFSREQLLDEYDICAAVLNTMGSAAAAGNVPAQLEIEYKRAVNEYNHDIWFEHDPRWYASIVLPIEQPEAAVKELIRCAERSDRYVQVMVGTRTERPLGNPKYWPVWEAAAHYGLPVATHTGGMRHHGLSCVGSYYYYEVHVGLSGAAQALTSSLIFEGVFDRFPPLKVVLTELAWAWAAPFAWRMDATWRVLRDEVSHLQRKPSDYFRDHFWFTSQPTEEPEDAGQIYALLEQFAAAGFEDKLLYSSDYPHWDFDPPSAAIPRRLPRDVKAKLLAGNAKALYGAFR